MRDTGHSRPYSHETGRRARLPPVAAVSPLERMVLAQRRGGHGVERDRTARRVRFQQSLNHLPVVLLELPVDVDHSAVQIHIAPAQPGRLATAQPPEARSDGKPRTAGPRQPAAGTPRSGARSTPPPEAGSRPRAIARPGLRSTHRSRAPNATRRGQQRGVDRASKVVLNRGSSPYRPGSRGHRDR